MIEGKKLIRRLTACSRCTLRRTCRRSGRRLTVVASHSLFSPAQARRTIKRSPPTLLEGGLRVVAQPVLEDMADLVSGDDVQERVHQTATTLRALDSASFIAIAPFLRPGNGRLHSRSQAPPTHCARCGALNPHGKIRRTKTVAHIFLSSDRQSRRAAQTIVQSRRAAGKRVRYRKVFPLPEAVARPRRADAPPWQPLGRDP